MPSMMNEANTFISTWPAGIATNSRRARLNGRTRNDTSSIAGISHSSHQGVPCGTKSEKKCRPWRQKPTISTIEKLRIARKPVIAKWLVTRSEEHTSELQSLMSISYAVFCLKKKNIKQHQNSNKQSPHE